MTVVWLSLASAGKGFQSAIEAARGGHVGAILLLLSTAIAIGFIIWRALIRDLIPSPATNAKRRWRWLGIASLTGFAVSSIAFLMLIAKTFSVFFPPLVFLCLTALAVRKCRDEVRHSE